MLGLWTLEQAWDIDLPRTTPDAFLALIAPRCGFALVSPTDGMPWIRVRIEGGYSCKELTELLQVEEAPKGTCPDGCACIRGPVSRMVCAE